MSSEIEHLPVLVVLDYPSTGQMKGKTEKKKCLRQPNNRIVRHFRTVVLASIHLVVFIWVAFVCVVLGVLYGERPWTSVKSVQFFVVQFFVVWSRVLRSCW